VLAEYDVDFLL